MWRACCRTYRAWKQAPLYFWVSCFLCFLSNSEQHHALLLLQDLQGMEANRSTKEETSEPRANKVKEGTVSLPSPAESLFAFCCACFLCVRVWLSLFPSLIFLILQRLEKHTEGLSVPSVVLLLLKHKDTVVLCQRMWEHGHSTVSSECGPLDTSANNGQQRCKLSYLLYNGRRVWSVLVLHAKRDVLKWLASECGCCGESGCVHGVNAVSPVPTVCIITCVCVCVWLAGLYCVSVAAVEKVAVSIV
jgi:hypothetical protein